MGHTAMIQQSGKASVNRGAGAHVRLLESEQQVIVQLQGRVYRLATLTHSFLSGPGCVGGIWEASLLLADWLHCFATPLLRGCRVLELGAGLALPSFVAAAQCAPSCVIATDYVADILACVQRSGELNSDGVAASQAAETPGIATTSATNMIADASPAGSNESPVVHREHGNVLPRASSLPSVSAARLDWRVAARIGAARLRQWSSSADIGESAADDDQCGGNVARVAGLRGDVYDEMENALEYASIGAVLRDTTGARGSSCTVAECDASTSCPTADVVLMSDIVYSKQVASALPLACLGCLPSTGRGTVIALLPTLGARRCAKNLPKVIQHFCAHMGDVGFRRVHDFAQLSPESIARYTSGDGDNEGFKLFIWRRQ